MSRIKEPRFFIEPGYMNKHASYEALFSHKPRAAVLGESTPLYSETTYFTTVPQRIYEYNSLSRIVYLVRAPLRRLQSVYVQALSTGHWAELKYYDRKMPLAYSDAVFDYPPFLEATKYWTHIQNYRRFFPDEAIKVVLFEDLTENTKQAVQSIFQFLRVDKNVEINVNSAKKNRGAGKTVYNPWPGRIRKLIPEAVLGSMPEGVKNLARDSVKILPVPKIAQPVLCSKDEARVRDVLAPEVEGIYRYLGIQDDPWNFFSDKTDDGEP